MDLEDEIAELDNESTESTKIEKRRQRKINNFFTNLISCNKTILILIFNSFSFTIFALVILVISGFSIYGLYRAIINENQDNITFFVLTLFSMLGVLMKPPNNKIKEQ